MGAPQLFALSFFFFLSFSCSIQPVYGAQHPPLDPRLTKK